MKSLLIVTLLVGVPSTGLAQQLTIPELVARSNGEPVYTSRIAEMVDVPIGDLIRASSLIVEGTVQPLATYMSADQRWIYTDYVLSPLHVYFSKNGGSRSTPGSTRLVVKVFGGALQLNGVKVHVIDEATASWDAGSHVFAFLVESAEAGKHELVFSFAGAFAVKGQRIWPLVKSPTILEEVRGMDKSRFAELVAKTVDMR